jgi:hypothetical protein
MKSACSRARTSKDGTGATPAEERMLEGQDFKGWDWCDTGGGVTIHAHIHSRGARDILSVSVTDDKPTGIVIVNDESGPC